MPENQPLYIQLQKAKCKKYVVANIEPVPESTDNKDVELVQRLALDSTSLVNTLSQPLLDTHVPVIYFFTNVRSKISIKWINNVDPFEILAIVSVYIPHTSIFEYLKNTESLIL